MDENKNSVSSVCCRAGQQREQRWASVEGLTTSLTAQLSHREPTVP